VANRFRDKPAGTLKLNVPFVAVRLVLPNLIPPFLAAYPDIRIEVTAEDSFVDVLAAGCDAGIRYDERLEQDMIGSNRTQRPVLRDRRRACLSQSPGPAHASARIAQPRLHTRPLQQRGDGSLGV
jgi:DNA-binding transcriptional LysR family regulator